MGLQRVRHDCTTSLSFYGVMVIPYVDNNIVIVDYLTISKDANSILDYQA